MSKLIPRARPYSALSDAAASTKSKGKAIGKAIAKAKAKQKAKLAAQAPETIAVEPTELPKDKAKKVVAKVVAPKPKAKAPKQVKIDQPTPPLIVGKKAPKPEAPKLVEEKLPVAPEPSEEDDGLDPSDIVKDIANIVAETIEEKKVPTKSLADAPIQVVAPWINNSEKVQAAKEELKQATVSQVLSALTKPVITKTVTAPTTGKLTVSGVINALRNR